MLRSSVAAKFLAVRRVTQDNRGKKTAGVDGVKSLGDNAVHSNQMREQDALHRIELETQRRNQEQPYEAANIEQLQGLNQSLNQFTSIVSSGMKLIAQQSSKQVAPKVEVINQPVPGLDVVLKALADTMENSIFPIVRSMDRKIDIDLKTHDKMKEISEAIREGAMAFLRREYRLLAYFVVAVASFLALSHLGRPVLMLQATAFIIGAICSGLALTGSWYRRRSAMAISTASRV